MNPPPPFALLPVVVIVPPVVSEVMATSEFCAVRWLISTSDAAWITSVLSVTSQYVSSRPAIFSTGQSGISPLR